MALDKKSEVTGVGRGGSQNLEFRYISSGTLLELGLLTSCIVSVLCWLTPPLRPTLKAYNGPITGDSEDLGGCHPLA